MGGQLVDSINRDEVHLWLGSWLDNGTTLVILSCIGIYGLNWALLASYRLYLHPLSSFKGPRSAALSRKWIYKVFTTEHMPEPIFEKVHSKYGVKALRVGPNELHLTDVSMYKTIYNQTTPYTKESSFYDGFLTPGTLFAETDPALHKERRKLLNPTFSKTSIRKLEPVIQQKIYTLAKKIKAICHNGSINVSDAYRCMTIDIIMRFAFGNESDAIHEDPSGFECALLRSFDTAHPKLVVAQESAMLRLVAGIIPMSFIAKVDKDMKLIHEIQETSVRDIRKQHERTETRSHPMIFENIGHLSDEAQAAQGIEMLLAGSDTSACVLSMSSFFILSSPDVEKKLKAVLREQIPDPDAMPSLIELEKIDYLWAVVKESLRMAMPARGRLPRIVPKGAPPLIVEGKVVPPGTVIAMSTYTMHTSTELWGPDARTYRPERWLSPDGTRDPDKLEEHLCTFSKGSRSCIGVNVAYAEIFMALAYLFRAFDMKLQTTKPDLRELFTMNIHGGMWIEFRESEK